MFIVLPLCSTIRFMNLLNQTLVAISGDTWSHVGLKQGCE